MLKGKLIIWRRYRWNIEKLIWKVNEFKFLNEEVEKFTSRWS